LYDRLKRRWYWMLTDEQTGHAAAGWDDTVAGARGEATRLYTAWKKADLYYGP
jgi:hypothetical protein